MFPGVKKILQQLFNSTMDKEEQQQIDAEYALKDVIHIVCRYVDREDLSNIALVCKSWECAALREQCKRSYIRLLRLPYGEKILDNSLVNVNKPYVSVLIYDEMINRRYLSLPPNIIPLDCARCSLDILVDEQLREFKTQLPNMKIILQVNEYFTMDGAEGQGITEVDRPKDILGLFISNFPQRIHVHLASIKVGDTRNSMSILSTRLTEELGLNDCEYSKSTIILLGSFYNFIELPDATICNSIFDLRKRAKQNGKRIALATFLGARLEGNHNCHSNEWADNKDLELFKLLRITGPTLVSWGTFIFHRAPLEEIERALQNLKERVKRKRFCTGFYFSPKCFTFGCTRISYPSGNSREMMGILNRIFPGIRFMGFFVNLVSPFIPTPNVQTFSDCDEFDPTKNEINLCYFASVTIITYD